MAAGGGQQNQNPAPSSTTHQQSPTRPSQSSHDADQTSLADGGGDGKAAISESDTSPSTSDAPNTNGPFVAVHSNSFRNPFKAIMQTRNSKKAAVNEPYQVNFPAPDTTYRKKSNYIRTTKYTLLTFLPLTLFYQVRNHNLTFNYFVGSFGSYMLKFPVSSILQHLFPGRRSDHHSWRVQS